MKHGAYNGRIDNPPYYLTTYALAVKHGFKGTEEEWIEATDANRVAAEKAKEDAEAAALSATEADASATAAAATAGAAVRQIDDIKKQIQSVAGNAEASANTAQQAAQQAAEARQAAFNSAAEAGQMADIAYTAEGNAKDSAAEAASAKTAAESAAERAENAKEQTDSAIEKVTELSEEVNKGAEIAKDAVKRAEKIQNDIVLVQEEQPTSEYNSIWVTESDEIEVYTAQEVDELVENTTPKDYADVKVRVENTYTKQQSDTKYLGIDTKIISVSTELPAEEKNQIWIDPNANEIEVYTAEEVDKLIEQGGGGTPSDYDEVKRAVTQNAEDIGEVEENISRLSESIVEISDDVRELGNGNGFFNQNLFTRASINSDGTLKTVSTYRVVNSDIQHNDTKRTLLCNKEGFRFGIGVYSQDGYKWNGWVTYGNEYVIEADIDYRLQIARVEESSAEIADFRTFVGCVVIKDVFQIERIENRISDNSQRIETIIADTYDKGYVIMEDITTESGYMNYVGKIITGGDRTELNVKKGEKYTFGTKTGLNARLYVLLDADRKVIDYYKTEDAWNTVHDFDVEYIVPSDGILVVNTIGRASELQVKIYSNISKLLGVYKSPLYGKKLSVNGDSICAGAGYLGGYAKIIGEMFNMAVNNAGVGGGTIAPSTDRHCISNTITSMPTDADYYLLEGGVNDSSLKIPLGAITSSYTATLDTTTFYGAFENMLKQAVIRFEGKKLGYIAVHQMTPNYRVVNDEATSYYWASKKCCEKWGVPFLDLNVNCPPLGYFDYEPLLPLKQKYTNNGDGWHPNEEGYKKYYVPKIISFLESL